MENSLKENDIINEEIISNKRRSILRNSKERQSCEISIKYMERLMGGRNPVNNQVIKTDTILTDSNLQKCFLFVVDILKRTLEEAETATAQSITSLTYKENIAQVIDEMVQEREVTITELNTIIQAYISAIFVEQLVKINVTKISNWLLEEGYLVQEFQQNRKPYRKASEKGMKIGMTNNLIQKENRDPYIQYRFNSSAQKFVLEHLDKIGVYKKEK